MKLHVELRAIDSAVLHPACVTRRSLSVFRRSLRDSLNASDVRPTPHTVVAIQATK